MSQSLMEFIQANRTEIDNRIEVTPQDDNERRLWLKHDSELYAWAHSEGAFA